jgi:hypothetical protein
MKYEELVLINSQSKRCAFCDLNLKGSLWRGINVALCYKADMQTKTRHQIICYYCVRCMTKVGTRDRKKHKRTAEQLDSFVDSIISQRLKP